MNNETNATANFHQGFAVSFQQDIIENLAKALQQALIKAVYTAQIIATLLRKTTKARALTPRLP